MLFTVAMSLYALYINHSIIPRWVLNPYKVTKEGQWYRLITSGIVHANMPHLLFNMITFFFFAAYLERMAGTATFMAIYIVALILSDIPTLIRKKDDPDYNSVGASGAISGVLFAYILYNPMSSIFIFPIPIPIPAVVFAILYLVYSQYAAKKQGDRINHSAHFWGALAGLITTIVLDPQIIPDLINNYF